MFRRTKICTAALLALGSGLYIGAHAQDAGTAPQRVEITGSSIKRVDTETSLPVQTVSRQQIDSLGVTTTEQLLQTISVNSTVGASTVAEGVGASTYGESTASMRSLGSQRTLILVNGRRLANYATDGTSVDINSIPLSAVERVEVLKDGASGVYGSDAIAGVINFILRKNFSGLEVSGYYGAPTEGHGGESSKGGFVLGFGDFDADRYNALFSVDVSHDQPIYGSQRSYANSSWDNGGRFDSSATPSGAIRTFDPNILTNHNQGSGLGNVLDGGGDVTAQTCSDNGSAWDANIGTCRYNPSPLVPLIPDVTHVNAAANLRVNVNQDMTFFLEGFAAHSRTLTSEQPSPYSVSFLATDAQFQKQGVNPAIVINPSSPYYPTAYLQANAPTVVGQPITVSYRAVDAGGRVHEDTANQYHFVTGLTGTVRGWDYDAAFSHNESIVEESTLGGYQSQIALVKLLSGNDAFDPFTRYQTPQLAAQIAATNYNGPMIHNDLKTDAIDAKASSEIYQLPGGPLSLAVGTSLRREKLDQKPSDAYQSGDISGYGNAVLPFSVSRNSYSLFTELDGQILKQLEADLSVRYDHYPNANSTNPKISVRYVPIQQVLLRGSFGTGFREASLPELYTPAAAATTAFFKDPVTGTKNQFTEFVGGNPNLVPEKSHQASAGIVLEPLKGLSASVDYFRIKVANDITALDAQTVVGLAASGNGLYVPLVQRDANNNIIQINLPNINVGSVDTDGVDVDVKWKSLKTAAGEFGLELNGTYTHKYNETLPDGTVQKSVGVTLDPSGNPITAVAGGGIIFRWRHELTGSWNYGPVGVDLTQHYQSGYTDSSRADCSTDIECATGVPVGAFSTWDIQGAYTGMKNLTLRLGLKNMFNRQPPNAITLGQYFQAGYDPTYYDPHGRFVYVSGSYKF